MVTAEITAKLIGRRPVKPVTIKGVVSLRTKGKRKEVKIKTLSKMTPKTNLTKLLVESSTL